MTLPNATPKDSLLAAALLHVPFDGWSDTTFDAAVQDTGVNPVLAKAICPRGAVDLALAYHHWGDAVMVDRLEAENLSDMRFRDRIAAAIRFRLEAVEDKELVRRGTTLFSLPQYAPDGAKLIWGTCDLIWDTLGDTSEDFNWYSKRTTLGAVYSSTVLYWLGDESEGHQNTWEFLDRRIDNVMQFEKVKAGLKKNPFLKGPMAALERIRAPQSNDDLPGRWPQNRPGHKDGRT